MDSKHTLRRLKKILAAEQDKSACMLAHFEYHPQKWESSLLSVTLNCPRYFARSSQSSVAQGGVVTAILDDITWMALQCGLMNESTSLGTKNVDL